MRVCNKSNDCDDSTVASQQMEILNSLLVTIKWKGVAIANNDNNYSLIHFLFK